MIRIIIELDIDGDATEAMDAVDAALDSGLLQDAINSDAIEVTSALSRFAQKTDKCPARCDCKTCRPELYVGGAK